MVNIFRAILKEKNDPQTNLENFHALFHALHDPCLLMQEGEIVLANRQFEQIFKGDENVHIERDFISYFHQVVERERVSHFLKTHSSDENLEVKAITVKGHLIYLNLMATRIIYNNIESSLITMKDITQVKQSEAELAHKNAQLYEKSKLSALGVMASQIAHEINNPLTVINGNMGILRKLLSNLQTKSSDKIENCLCRVEKHVARMTKIIKSIRNVSRGETQTVFQKTFTHQIVDDVLDLCRNKFFHAEIELRLDEIPKDQEVYCDSIQVSQILVNLFNNAMDAIEVLDEKWIRISTFEDDEYIKFLVTDSGDGIPESDRAKIFSSFYTSKEAGKGTGIGLSISKTIANTHGGDLYLDHSQPNTTFVLTIPKNLKDLKTQEVA